MTFWFLRGIVLCVQDLRRERVLTVVYKKEYAMRLLAVCVFVLIATFFINLYIITEDLPDGQNESPNYLYLQGRF